MNSNQNKSQMLSSIWSNKIREKRDNMKILPLLKKKNPRNANALKSKARRELTHTKKNNQNPFKVKSIKLEIQ